MPGPAEGERGFAGQEEPLTEALGRLDAAVAHALEQTIAAMFGSDAFQGLSAGEHPQANLKEGPVFALGPQEGAVDFGQDNLPLPIISGRDLAIDEDGRLQLVLFSAQGRPGGPPP